MDCWSQYYMLTIITFLIIVIAETSHIRTIDVHQDERIRLECIVTSKLDAEEVMWMRIRPPHNPDILTYRDDIVYASNRIQLEQRRLSSGIDTNGTVIDKYFLILTILKPNIDDEGRYICSKDRKIFAEYDLFIIVPPRFVNNNRFIQQRTIIEGSTLKLSCSAYGRPQPSITWFYRTKDRKHVSLGYGKSCQETICELNLGNYSRNDPTTIECVADNQKSTRISKIFHIDVVYPPSITTNIRTLTRSNSIDVYLHCLSVSNPLASIIWLDKNKQKINNSYIHKIKTRNQSSILSFSIYSHQRSSVIFYCQSNNSIGIDEKLINISNFIKFDITTIAHLTSSRVTYYLRTSTRKSKTFRSRLVTTTKRIKQLSSNSFISYSASYKCVYLIYIVCFVFKLSYLL